MNLHNWYLINISYYLYECKIICILELKFIKWIDQVWNWILIEMNKIIFDK